MSVRLPKRVKDLPRLEPDSEDELKTPAKLKAPSLRDKENFDIYNTFRNPKRVAELPPLESDSDDCDNKNDKLNCAILNESFIMSPSKSIEEIDNTSLVNKIQKENDKNQINDLKNSKNDSFSLDFQKLNVDEVDNIALSTKSKSNQAPFKSFLPPSTVDDPQNQPFSLFRQFKRNNCQKAAVPFGTSRESQDFITKSNSNTIFRVKSSSHGEATSCAIGVPKKTRSEEIVREKNNDLINKSCIENEVHEQPIKTLQNSVETPFKTAETNFVTPQVKSFQMPTSRRQRLLNSRASQKTRSALEDEFRTPKILFQTPIAVSRPPVNTMAPDGILLSLDDSREIAKNEKLSPITELKKSKKSPNELFCTVKQTELNTNQCSEKIITINERQYLLQKKIGSGGSSLVYLAKRRDNQIDCALKIVDLRGDRSVVEGYLNETKLLAKLQGNVNVVSLYEYEHKIKESTLYMVMEKGDSDLHKILQSYKTNLPLYTLMNFWYQMLQSVNYIHENGVIHSDLKPANFLMVDGRLKLIDFGIASNIAIDSTSIIKFSQAGTFNYISPEALIDTSTGNSPSGKNQPKIKISTKSDVWSLGCILYFLLYKKTPFGHITNVYGKANAISNPSTKIEYPELPNYYPPILTEMAKKCLQHNPKQRLSVSELLQYPFKMVIPIEK